MIQIHSIAVTAALFVAWVSVSTPTASALPKVCHQLADGLLVAANVAIDLSPEARKLAEGLSDGVYKLRLLNGKDVVLRIDYVDERHAHTNNHHTAFERFAATLANKARQAHAGADSHRVIAGTYQAIDQA